VVCDAILLDNIYNAHVKIFIVYMLFVADTR
jgi:hypothetical protein